MVGLAKVAFTWSPAPHLQAVQPKWSYSKQIERIKQLRRCCESVTIAPELFANGGMHWHGELVISDMIKWHKSILPSFKRSGFVKIKTDVDQGWNEYIRKDNDMMCKILDMSLPLVKEDLNRMSKRERKTCVKDIDVISVSDDITKWFRRVNPTEGEPKAV